MMKYMKENGEGYTIFLTKNMSKNDKVCFRCPNGHEYMSKFEIFRTGSRCPKCYASKNYKYNNRIFDCIFKKDK